MLLPPTNGLLVFFYLSGGRTVGWERRRGRGRPKFTMSSHDDVARSGEGRPRYRVGRVKSDAQLRLNGTDEVRQPQLHLQALHEALFEASMYQRIAEAEERLHARDPMSFEKRFDRFAWHCRVAMLAVFYATYGSPALCASGHHFLLAREPLDSHPREQEGLGYGAGVVGPSKPIECALNRRVEWSGENLTHFLRLLVHEEEGTSMGFVEIYNAATDRT